MHLRPYLRSVSLMGLLAVLLVFTGVATAQDRSLVIYAGRSKSLVEPLVEKFQKDTGIRVQVRYAPTTQLALALVQEGDRSMADVFWAQDTGALELLSEKDLFIKLPTTITHQTIKDFRSDKQDWIATSARGRTLAYSPTRVAKSDLPASVMDLTDPKWKGRIGWAPANASFQAFVTAMRSEIGDDKTRDWLKGIAANEPKAYPRNSPILDAIAAGEVDLGLLNHYYLVKVKSQKPDFAVEQTTFENKGDLGNLLFVAGAGVLKSSKRQELAQQFLSYLLTDESQLFFTTDVYEYAVTPGVKSADAVNAENARQAAPDVPYSHMQDLDGTLKMLRDLGLL